MKALIAHKNKTYRINLNQALDISLPLRGDPQNPTAWYLDGPTITPVKDSNFVGKVSEGASTNFNNIFFNPHAHGTHTECVGHITHEFHSIHSALQNFFFFAKLISLEPKKHGSDLIIEKYQLENLLKKNEAQALIIRTLPNSEAKRNKKYSHTNWPYLTAEAARYIRECEIEHLLIDLPSVDKEKDEGKLSAHKAFWNYTDGIRFGATITEMIFVPNNIEDGYYFLNLQIASFVNDATPSKPILYKIEPK